MTTDAQTLPVSPGNCCCDRTDHNLVRVLAPVSEGLHHPSCKWPTGHPCRKFSTDGTRLGSQIAHEMGTTSEDEIQAMADKDAMAAGRAGLTGMSAEQDEWESEEGSAWRA